VRLDGQTLPASMPITHETLLQAKTLEFQVVSIS
jgi:hypothetical protein